MIILIAALLGGLFNHIRGGFLNGLLATENTKLKLAGKLSNALVFGLGIGYLTQSYLAIPCAFFAMILGASFHWGEWVGGIVNKQNVSKNSIYLSIRGFVWTLILAISIYYFNHHALWIIPVGFLMPLGYYLASLLPITPPRAWQWGEVIWGAILWGFIALILTI